MRLNDSSDYVFLLVVALSAVALIIYRAREANSRKKVSSALANGLRVECKVVKIDLIPAVWGTGLAAQTAVVLQPLGEHPFKGTISDLLPENFRTLNVGDRIVVLVNPKDSSQYQIVS